MTTYTTLPSLVGTVGTFSFTLYSDFAGLTVPSVQTILEIGETTEVADIGVGIAQASTLRVTLRDDYSTYAYGFWFKVLSGETRLRIYLNQGAGDTFYFFGVVQNDTVSWDEHYIGTSRIRTVSFELVTMISAIIDTPTTTWVDEVLANDVATGSLVSGQPDYMISVKGLFAAMLSASGLNSSYSAADVTFVSDTTDFTYKVGANTYDLDNIWVVTHRYSGATDAYFAHTDNLPTNRDGLEFYYVTLGAMLRDLLANFGIVLRMNYNTGTERHLIELIQRGRAYSATLDFEGREVSSEIRKSFDLIGDAVRVQSLENPTGSTPFDESVWVSKKYTDGILEPTTNIPEPQDYIDFDVDLRCIFVIGALHGTTSYHSQLMWWDGSTGSGAGFTQTMIDAITYRNYSNDTDVAASLTYLMHEAMAAYIYYRFTDEYTSITRTYSKLMAATGTDHTALNILKRTTIDDGLASNVYYANKVIKDPESLTTTIEWILE